MKLWRFFFLLLLLFGGEAQAIQGSEVCDTVRLLAIGNSFSEDAVEQYLFEMGKADGRVLIIGNMYIGGCTLERHVNNVRENRADYAYRKIGSDGIRIETENVALETALADEKWDYVSFQQASPLSGQFETYRETLPELLAYVKTRTGTHTQFVIHQTWAYAADSDHEGFAYYDNDQVKMYECIVHAYQKAAELVGISILVPSGTAIQNARTSFIGDRLNRDGYHLDLKIGRFTAACAWYETLFGNIRNNGYAPEGMTSDYAEVARLSAYYAVREPFKVTPIQVENRSAA